MKLRILIAATALSVSGCSIPLTSSCEDTVKTEVRSPNGEIVAALYERDCGATTDFSTIVNLRAGSTGFSGKEGIVLVVKGQRRIDLLWKDDTTLRLACHECRTDDIFEQKRSWRNVGISYCTEVSQLGSRKPVNSRQKVKGSRKKSSSRRGSDAGSPIRS